ncbi:hypothetical protein NR798_36540 [Archangium gephyra]|uniref:hypothetical protein n=1 Tax=Archangium gephyra TaxID=48 RepID=UPI0035D47A85
MNRSQSVARAAHARGSASRPVVLFLLLAQVAATGCQPEPGPLEPTPAFTETSSHALAAAPVEEAIAADPLEQTRTYRGVLTTRSLHGPPFFHYDAFVVTARQSGPVDISSDVIAVGPDGYIHGYGYPLSIASIEEGATLTAIGGMYLQNALEDGTAVIQYPVQEGRQYILVYKTFSNFMPLTYRLRLPTTLKMEGRIDSLPAPVPVPAGETGQISLENPRPATLSRIVDWLNPRMGS